MSDVGVGAGETAARRGRRALFVLCGAALVGAAMFVTVNHRAKAVEDSALAPPTLLEAVSASSATDAWAVGYSNFGQRGVIVHWDGRSWSPVSGPSAAKLFGVSAISSSDAWSVGTYSAPQSHTVQTMVLHWDGSMWTRVPSPNPSAFLNLLYGVSAVSSTDAWAVGYSLSTNHQFHSLLLHWNGAKWSAVPVPGPELDAVTAVSSRSAWAVGRGVLLHWNGTRWSKQPIRTRNFLESVRVIKLLGVSAVSPTNVWAVGQRCAHFGPCVKRTEIVHWNGRRWSTVRSPVPSRSFNVLDGVSALSARNVWAAGVYCTTSCSRERTLIVHWNGRRWSRVPSPDRRVSVNLLAGVGGAARTEVWAVGGAGGRSGTNSLLLDWNGTEWSTS